MASRVQAQGFLIGSPLNPRKNSLNLIRLILALSVLVHHAWPLSGSSNGPSFAGETLGGWAVEGFFGISGYLITGSRFSHSLGNYLVHRITRIMPAVLACLIVVAGIFGPLGYWASTGHLRGYLSTPSTPFNYVFGNLFLQMNQYGVAGTPAGVPYPGAWDGSLWSLYYEFLCYLIVAVLGIFLLVRKSPWPLTIAFGVSVGVFAAAPYLGAYTEGNGGFTLLFQVLPFFLGGAVLHAWKHRIGIHWLLGLVSLILAISLAALVPRWGGQLAGIFVAYFILWVSSWLPTPKLIAKNDVSYGVYIYAFPVQQILAVYSVHLAGLPIYIIAAIVITLPLAIASWTFIERPAMRRMRKGPGTKTAAHEPMATPLGLRGPSNGPAQDSPTEDRTPVLSDAP